MTALSKSKQQGEYDQATIATALRNKQWASEVEAMDSKSVQAYEEFLKVCKKRQEMHQQMNAEVTAAQGVKDEAHANLDRCRKAAGELQRLLKDNPVVHQVIQEAK